MLERNMCFFHGGSCGTNRCGNQKCNRKNEDYKTCELYKTKIAEHRKARERDEKCNNNVRLCQTCQCFSPTVFSHEDELYYDERLGCFTLWIWKGYCSKTGNKTKSDEYCKSYKKKEIEAAMKITEQTNLDNIKKRESTISREGDNRE